MENLAVSTISGEAIPRRSMVSKEDFEKWWSSWILNHDKNSDT